MGVASARRRDKDHKRGTESPSDVRPRTRVVQSMLGRDLLSNRHDQLSKHNLSAKIVLELQVCIKIDNLRTCKAIHRSPRGSDRSGVSIRSPIQDGSSKLGSQSLHSRVRSIRQMSGRNSIPLTNAIALQADIKRLAVPVLWDTTDGSRKTIRVPRARPSILVHIRRETSAHAWVSNEENALDSVKVVACDLGHCVDGRCGTLGVAFQDEARVRVAGECGLDFVDNLCGDGVSDTCR